MTGKPQQYIITGDEIRAIAYDGVSTAGLTRKRDALKSVKSHPYQSEREKVLDVFLAEMRSEMTTPFEYLDWDSIESVYVRLRQHYRRQGENE